MSQTLAKPELRVIAQSSCVGSEYLFLLFKLQVRVFYVEHIGVIG